MAGPRSSTRDLLGRSTGWSGDASFINASGVHSNVILKYTFTVTKNVGTEKNAADKLLKNTKLLGTLAVEHDGVDAGSALFAAEWFENKYDIVIRRLGHESMSATEMYKDSTSLEVVGLDSGPAAVGLATLS